MPLQQSLWTGACSSGDTMANSEKLSMVSPDLWLSPELWHTEWNLGATGIQILARDVDGDGLSDLVYGMGHDYGLLWIKQGKSASGERTWTKGVIDDTVAS